MTEQERAMVRPQLRQPRLAEIVASTLRDRILDGQFEDGAMLPSQQRLLDEFYVSKPSLREALRILETEGLITVQRGNVGGAIVHQPKAGNAAYTLAMVLQSRHVAIDDVGQAMKQLEAGCAALCAGREDRIEAVVPYLRKANEDAHAAIADELAYVQAMADFHEEMIARCGNQTLMLVAGALEAMWLSHVHSWAEQAVQSGGFPDPGYRERGIEAHEQITELIADGDVQEVHAFAYGHFDPTQFYGSDSDARHRVRASAIRRMPHHG